MMTTITSPETTSTFPATDTIVEALQHLSPKYWPEVLQFIQFLEYKSINALDDTSEDEALWDAVQANQAYKAQHPDEVLERYQSGPEFLKAMEEWRNCKLHAATEDKPSKKWPSDFFEKTAGCLADDPIERAPQGDYEIRTTPNLTGFENLSGLVSRQLQMKN